MTQLTKIASGLIAEITGAHTTRQPDELVVLELTHVGGSRALTALATKVAICERVRVGAAFPSAQEDILSGWDLALKVARWPLVVVILGMEDDDEAVFVSAVADEPAKA
jgi:hypothetical protein